MSPQPTAAPAAPAAAPVEVVPHKALMDRIAAKLEKGDALTGVEKQINRAVTLERERAGVAKKIGANREYLRLMEENEEITDDDELDWLEDFYPQKEKGQPRSEDDLERTRKAKAAARA